MGRNYGGWGRGGGGHQAARATPQWLTGGSPVAATVAQEPCEVCSRSV